MDVLVFIQAWRTVTEHLEETVQLSQLKLALGEMHREDVVKDVLNRAAGRLLNPSCIVID